MLREILMLPTHDFLFGTFVFVSLKGLLGNPDQVRLIQFWDCAFPVCGPEVTRIPLSRTPGTPLGTLLVLVQRWGVFLQDLIYVFTPNLHDAERRNIEHLLDSRPQHCVSGASVDRHWRRRTNAPQYQLFHKTEPHVKDMRCWSTRTCQKLISLGTFPIVDCL